MPGILLYDQNTGRAISTLLQFGPAWALRPVFANTPDAFMVVAHALYFAVPLVLWLILRLVEPQRLFSRLYLAIVLALVFFTSEMVQGIGLWMIWFALLADPARSRGPKAVATLLLAPVLAFTHPGIALLSVAVGACGGALDPAAPALPATPRGGGLGNGPVPDRSLISRSRRSSRRPIRRSPPSMPEHGTTTSIRLWMLATLGFFPVLIALWLLLLAPGLEGTGLRWRLSGRAMLIVGAVGVWFALNGAQILTWIFARPTAPYVLALALALALASPMSAWSAAARRPLMIYSMIVAAATLSYTVDLALFARAAEALLAPLEANDTAPPRFVEIEPSPTPAVHAIARGYFKWLAGDNYVRDVVVPDYGGQRMTFAFYTFFQSGRRVVLFRPLARRGEWVPFECAPVDRALARPHDAIDARMLSFLRERYCVGKT